MDRRIAMKANTWRIIGYRGNNDYDGVKKSAKYTAVMEEVNEIFS